MKKYFEKKPKIMPGGQEAQEENTSDKDYQALSIHKDEHDDHHDEVYFELAFFSGVSNALLTVFILAKFPQYFWMWYIPKCVCLITYRFFHWKAMKLQFFLLDFCYIANFTLVLYLCLGISDVVSSDFLEIGFRIIFALSNGPLAWAIGLFRNSLVFHSPDKITSLFIHIEPPVVCWAMRWFTNGALIDVCGENCAASPAQLILYPLAYYILFWSIPYGIWLCLVGAQLSEKKGYQTLYSHTLKINKLVRKVVLPMGKFGPIGYMLIHFCFSLCVIVLSLLWWNNFWCHTIFLVIMFEISTWNASTFYVTKVFSEKALHNRR